MLARQIESFRNALQAVGGRVELADDFGEGSGIVRRICKENKVRSIVVADQPNTKMRALKSILTDVEVNLLSELSADKAVKTIASADMGVTDARACVASTGTVALLTHNDLERLVSCLPRHHLVLLEPSQMVDSVKEIIPKLGESLCEHNYTLSMITGSSSTADIEETLVRGVHGPHRVWAVIIGGRTD